MATNPIEDLVESVKQAPSYFLGNAPPGSPLSYEALQSRRRIAEAMMGKRSPFPKTIGEGLTYFGEALGDRMMSNQLYDAERRQAAGEAAIMANSPDRVRPAPTAVAATEAPPASAISPAGMATDTEYNAIDAGADLNQQAYDQTFKGTPLEGKNQQIAAAAAKYGISPALLSAVVAHETGSGTSNMLRNRNNPGGIMDPRTNSMTGQSYPDIDSGIDAAGRVIANNYRRGGNTIEGMARSYAPPGANNDPGNLNRFWPSGVGKFYDRFSPQVPAASNDSMPAAAAEPAAPPTPDVGRDAIASAVLAQQQIPGSAPVMPSDAFTAAASETPSSAAAPAAAPAVVAAPSSAAPYANPPTYTDIPAVGRPQSAVPSKEPIATYVPEIVPHPGKAPERLPRPPETLNMTYWKQFAGNPNVSPQLQKHAEEVLKEERAAHKTLEEQQENDYRDQRAQHNQQVLAHEKSVREEPVRRQEFLVKNLAIEAAQETNPFIKPEKELALANATADLDKKRYDATQRGAAEEKARLENKIKAQEAAKGQTQVLGEKLLRYDPQTGEPIDITPPVQIGDVKLTEQQASALDAYNRGIFATRNLGDAKILGGLVDRGKGMVPIGGNYAVSNEYQHTNTLANAWVKAFLRKESGAVIPDSEIAGYKAQYFPVPGDKPENIAEKHTLRVERERSMYETLGPGRKVADEYKGTIAFGQREGDKRTSASTGRSQIVKHGRWVEQ